MTNIILLMLKCLCRCVSGWTWLRAGMLSGTRFIVPDKISISLGLDKIEGGQSVSKMSLIVRSVY